MRTWSTTTILGAYAAAAEAPAPRAISFARASAASVSLTVRGTGVAGVVVRDRERVEAGAAQERRGRRPRFGIRAEGREVPAQRERRLEVGDGEIGGGDLVADTGEERVRVGRSDRRHTAAEHDVAGEDETNRARA